MYKRGSLMLAVGIAAVVAISGCGNGGSSSAAGSASASASVGLKPGPIIIGAAIAESGLFQPYDAGIQTIKSDIAAVNAAGGVLGHPLKLVIADTRSDLQHAAVAAQQVISQGAKVMLVTCDSGAGAPAALVATQAGILTFTLCASEPVWNPPNFNGLAFSAFGSIASEGAAGAQYLMNAKQVRHPFLLIDTADTYGPNACKAFAGYMKHMGIAIAGTAEFKNADTSIAGQVAQVQASHADGIADCSFPPGGASAIKQLRAAGVDVPIWGPQAFDGNFWLSSVPNLSNFYVTTPGSDFGNDPRPAVNAVVQKYVKLGSQNTTLLAAYTTLQIIDAAIAQAHSVNGHALASELETWRSKPTLIGPTTFTKTLHVPNRDWYILQIQNGKDSYVSHVMPTFIPDIVSH